MKIMKKNILFGVVCVALLTATSCSDFLDVQPEGDARDNAYFLNDQQAIDAVDGLYERFHQEAMYGRELFWEQGAANDIVWGKTRDFPTLSLSSSLSPIVSAESTANSSPRTPISRYKATSLLRHSKAC